MGRKEVYYKYYDYFYPGGYALSKEFCNYDNIFIYLPCIIMQIINWLIYSNIIDIFLLIKIAYMLKDQRITAQNLISSKALSQRKR